MSKDEFDKFARYWNVKLADDKFIDLKPDGSNTRIKYEEIEEYVRAVIETRLQESQP